MEPPLRIIPPRVRYYLMDWKDNHMEEYLEMFPGKRMYDLSIDEIKKLFEHVTEYDKTQIDNP